MLHRINPPNCQAQMDWIVDLQRRLLNALCAPEMTPDQVHIEWVVSLLQDLHLQEKWVRKFCNRRDEVHNVHKPMLEHMHVIAGLDQSLKNQLIETFENDLLFLNHFGAQPGAGRRLIGIAFLDEQPKEITNAVRGFFDSFYNPNFMTSVSYHIHRQKTSNEHFNRTEFIEHYKESNTRVKVCPACDGSMSPPDLDHFYPKSKFPFIVCSLLNLVPICSDCNKGQGGKHAKTPLTQGASNQTADWFHPYLRPIHGTYEFRFVRKREGTTLILHSDDSQTQTRLNNYQWLFGVEQRWRNALPDRVSSTIEMVQDLHKKNANLTQGKFAEEICKRTSVFQYDKGKRPFVLIDCAYFESVSRQDRLTFDELWIVYSGGDPITGP